jgi:DNA primase
VLALPGAADPDKFIREKGAEAYQKLLAQAPAFLDYLITRARAQFDLTTAEGKLRAVNFLMPYVQRMPNRLMRSEWATRIASQLRIEEPVLRESMRKAASERRSEVKPKPELIAPGAKPAERRLIRMLVDAEGFRAHLAEEIRKNELHKGLETEKIFAALLPICERGNTPDAGEVEQSLEPNDRNVFARVVFEPASEPTWEEAESCLGVLRRRQIEVELVAVQKELEGKPPAADQHRLFARKRELRKLLSSL